MRSSFLSSVRMMAVFASPLGLAFWLAGLSAAYAGETPDALTVPSVKGTLQLAVPVPTNALPSNCLSLVETDRPKIHVRGQLIAAMSADGTLAKGKLCVAASIPPREGASGTRRFRLVALPTRSAEDPAASARGGFSFREIDHKSLALDDAGKPVLVYNFGVITDSKVPKSDPRRSRACFVHPLYGLNGEVLSDSFPKDHYHHHGIFWAWPHVGIGGKQYDLWVDQGIRQRFVRWICRETGPVAAVLAMENGWFVGDKKVMIERVWLRAYKPAGGQRSIDLEFVFIPVDKPITLRGAENKSYGGLNLRYAPRKDTVITVPSGRTKDDLPDTRLAWADLTAKFAGAPGPSGVAIFVDPKHPDFPPTWLTRHYGILCCGYPGVQGKTFLPGEPIRLNYRVWIHKSAASLADLQQAFDAYGAGKSAAARWQ